MNINVGYQMTILKWSPSVNIGMQKQFYHPTLHSEPLNLSTPIYSVRLYNFLRLPHDITIMANYRVSTSGHTQFIYESAKHIITLGVTKYFMKGKLSIQLLCDDLLNQYYNYRYISFSDAVDSEGQNEGTTRSLTLRIKYQFNSSKSRYKGQGAGATERERL
jgi:hypothetical protein